MNSDRDREVDLGHDLGQKYACRCKENVKHDTSGNAYIYKEIIHHGEYS